MDIKKRAFKLAMPVMLSYLFMSLAYGLMMQQAHLGCGIIVFLPVFLFIQVLSNMSLSV
ncbi:hypothetical protein [Sharpea porci]|uniref:hypothetical protein n=1 Tax=Sharpea porci TaxID=2652286 RepID=UPI0012B1D1A4|nr:hypothetical protein [Sharpea porci]